MNIPGAESVRWHEMKSYQSRLAKGQVWKTRIAQIEIVGLGKRMIHYRITKHLGVKRVSAQISGIQAMEDYLRANQAVLITGISNN